ncbi:MAG: hypothetical protein ACRDWB_14295 [Acidimicrobiales bacterium]
MATATGFTRHRGGGLGCTAFHPRVPARFQQESIATVFGYGTTVVGVVGAVVSLVVLGAERAARPPENPK